MKDGQIPEKQKKDFEEIDSRPQLKAAYQGGFKNHNQEKKVESRNFKCTDLKPVVDKQRLTHEELDTIDDQRRELGKKLATQIYELAHVKREDRVEVYIKAINDVVLELESAANIAILESAKEYFTLLFGTALRGKGLSPQLIDAVIHRTGRQNRALFERLLKGFNVEEIALDLWELDINEDPGAQPKALDFMRELTNRQVGELREFYSTLPAKLLANLIHEALYRTNLEGKSYPDISLIRYILIGRNKLEVSQIEFQYNEKYHFVRFGESLPTLRDAINQLVSGKEASGLESLLEGFSAEYFANKINLLISDCINASEPSTGEGLHADFSGNFRSNYSDVPHWEKELRARDAIDDLLEFCSQEQFEEIRAAYLNLYDALLTPELYYCNQVKSFRKIAQDLQRGLTAVLPRREFRRDEDYLSDDELHEVKDDFRLSTNREIKDVIKSHAEESRARECAYKVYQALSALRFLNSKQIIEVDSDFKALFGVDLHQFVEQEIDRICRGEIHKYSSKVKQIFLSGLARIPLKADLFHLFQSKADRTRKRLELEELKKRQEIAHDAIERIVRILNRNQQANQKAVDLLAYFRELGSKILPVVEDVYFEFYQEHLTFSQLLQSSLPEDEFKLLDFYLNGLDLDLILTNLKSHPESVVSLFLLNSEAVRLLIKGANNSEALNLEQLLRNSLATDPKSLRIALSFYYGLEAGDLKELISQGEVLNEEQQEKFLKYFNKSNEDILSFEVAYNSRFSRFRYSNTRFYGNLLYKLREIASQGLLGRSAFSEAILFLEGLDNKLAIRLKNLLADPCISIEDLSVVESTFHSNRANLSTIKKAYNALDEEQTLREAIYSLVLPLRVKNRMILALDGYEPAEVANEIHEAIKALSGTELATRIDQILAVPNAKNANHRIPSNPNWVDEMYNQIRLAYHTRYGMRLISALRRRDVPLKGIGVNHFSYKIYGDISKSVIDFHRVLGASQSNLGNSDSELKLARLIEFLSDIVPALRERLLDMYLAYFGVDDVANSDVLEYFQKLFSATSSWEQLEDLIVESEVWDQPELEKEEEKEIGDLDQLLEELKAVA